MSYKFGFCTVIIVLLECFTTFAQEKDTMKLPDTPVARQFNKFLQAIESGDYQPYIQENFSQSFLDAFPLSTHLEFFKQMHITHGRFSIRAIEKSTEHELIVLVKSKKLDAWRRLVFHTEPRSPYKVTGIQIDMASSPDKDQEQIKKMSEKEILQYAEGELKRMVEKDEFSGAVLIAKGGQLILKQAYGMASKRFNVPNNVDTKFNIGSINKSFTQMAIAQLLEKGRICLDDKISRYLDNFPEEIGNKVTIRHLLTMRSGMGHYWTEEWRAKWATIKTVDALIEIIKKIHLDFEPGAKQQYSNSGYVVLGAIIEKVTGQSYYDYVRQNVFEPVGMFNTDSYELDQVVPNLAIGYTSNLSQAPYANNKWQNNLFLHSVKGSPAGGGYSTVDDLNLYVESLKENKLANEKYTNMVLGLFGNIDNSECRPGKFGIAGGAPIGINAVMEADLENGYTVIVLSNYDPPVAEKLGKKIFNMLCIQSSNEN